MKLSPSKACTTEEFSCYQPFQRKTGPNWVSYRVPTPKTECRDDRKWVNGLAAARVRVRNMILAEGKRCTEVAFSIKYWDLLVLVTTDFSLVPRTSSHEFNNKNPAVCRTARVQYGRRGRNVRCTYMSAASPGCFASRGCPPLAADCRRHHVERLWLDLWDTPCR